MFFLIISENKQSLFIYCFSARVKTLRFWVSGSGSVVTFVFLGDQLKQFPKLFHSTGLARFRVFRLGLKHFSFGFSASGSVVTFVFLGDQLKQLSKLFHSTGLARFLVFWLASKHFAFGFSGSGTNSSLNYSYPLTFLTFVFLGSG